MTASGKLNVLLIGCPEAVVRAVADGGHDAQSSEAARTELGRVRDTILDVIIVDLATTNGDPFALAQNLGSFYDRRKPMVLGLTDRTSAALDAQCKDAGIDLLFIKPVAPALVTQFLGRLNTVVQDFESFDPMI